MAIGLGSPAKEVRKPTVATTVNRQLNKAGHNTLSPSISAPADFPACVRNTVAVWKDVARRGIVGYGRSCSSTAEARFISEPSARRFAALERGRIGCTRVARSGIFFYHHRSRRNEFAVNNTFNCEFTLAAGDKGIRELLLWVHEGGGESHYRTPNLGRVRQ